MRVVGDFNDWGLEGVALFLQLLESHMFPLGRGGDQMRWKLKSSGDFSVRSSYEALRGSPPVFLWRAIWGAKAPKRVSFFVWIATWGKSLLEGGDQMRWKLKRSGDFSVRSSYGHYGAHPLCLSFVGPYGGLRLLKEFPFCVDSNLGENPYSREPSQGGISNCELVVDVPM